MTPEREGMIYAVWARYVRGAKWPDHRNMVSAPVLRTNLLPSHYDEIPGIQMAVETVVFHRSVERPAACPDYQIVLITCEGILLDHQIIPPEGRGRG